MMDDNTYGLGNESGTPVTDQRAEFRLTGRARVELEQEAALPGGAGASGWLQCRSSDVSASGMRIWSEVALSEGALLPARVSLDEAERVYELIVEVVWCRRQDDGGCRSGLRIIESDDTACLEWLDAVARALAEDW